MDKDKQIKPVVNYSLEQFNKESGIIERGLSDLKISEDPEICKYCGDPVQVLDSDGVCHQCLESERTEPITYRHNLLVEDQVFRYLNNGDYAGAHKVLDNLIEGETPDELEVGGEKEIWRNGKWEVETTPERRYKFKEEFKKKIEKNRLKNILWKAKLFEDQGLADEAIQQYKKVLEIFPENEYARGKLNNDS